MYDIAIIGAGIIGSFLAHELSRYQLKAAVIDQESDIANGVTMANSAIIHAGHDPEEGTMKARFNKRGNEMYPDICGDLGVSFQRTSAFVAAVSPEEEEKLEQLYSQAVDRGIPVHRLSGEEARALEPNLSAAVTGVIELPTTGIVYPWEVAIALAEEACINGVDFCLNHQVTGIDRADRGQEEDQVFQIFCTNLESTESDNPVIVEARYVINAAGLYADQIYRMVSKQAGFEITPRRGEYFVLDKMKEPLVKRVIYPLPSEAGKGVLAVPTTHGNLLLGPNAQAAETPEDNQNTLAGLEQVRSQLAKTVANIPMNKVIRTFAGLRPTGNVGDFVVEEAADMPGFFQAACIESPGLASAPAIAEYMVQELLKSRIDLIEKEIYQRRAVSVPIKDLSPEDRVRAVQKRPAYGRIICRCEQISEGEIEDAIHRPLGARTVKAVKKRVRPGMGRCQGGFCEPLVVDILARERNIPRESVRLDGPGSELLLGSLDQIRRVEEIDKIHTVRRGDKSDTVRRGDKSDTVGKIDEVHTVRDHVEGAGE